MNRASSRTTALPTDMFGLLAKLHNIKLGAAGASRGGSIPRNDLAYILRSLATLIKNGVSLKRALTTLADERTLKRYRGMLHSVRRKIEAGEAFSTALKSFPATFDELVVNQVRIGERSGTISESLKRIASHFEKADQLRAKIIKRLSYPATVMIAGAAVVLFMLTYVVPQFEMTYRQAKVPLPIITTCLICVGHFAIHYGWVFAVGLAAGWLAVRRARSNGKFAYRMDRCLLRVPVLGDWLRDIAVLQFMDVMAVMMQSGFKLVDALGYSAGSIGNHAIRQAVEGLRLAVIRGERLSHELNRHPEMFPPVVSQLVIVGEQTGNLSKSTSEVREHLRQQIDRKAEIFVGAVEPILTVGMAVAIGAILLAIYLPMFSMVDVVDSMGNG